MTAQTALFTIATKNRLHTVRVLMDSVRQHHPHWRQCLVLADRLDGCFDPAQEAFDVVEAEALPVPRFRQLAFLYTPLELCCALKPFGFLHLLDRPGVERVVYLDSDIVAYRPLAEVEDWPAELDILLTPSAMETAPGKAGVAKDQGCLRLGLYNLGFAAARRSPTSRELMQWWGSRLVEDCQLDVRHGIFLDQEWMDLAPLYFPSCGQVRHKGYNIGHWNLSLRSLTGEPGQGLRANGAPLVFFHFSHHDPSGKSGASAVKGLDPGTQQVVRELVADYDRRLAAAGIEHCLQWPYSYAAFSDGTRIHDSFRLYYRRISAHGVAPPEHPLDAAEGGVLEHLTAGWKGTALTGAAAALYLDAADHPERHRSAPLHEQAAFAHWFARCGAAEAGVDRRFIQAQERHLESWRRKASAESAEALPMELLELVEVAGPSAFRGLAARLKQYQTSYEAIMAKPLVRAWLRVRDLLRSKGR